MKCPICGKEFYRLGAVVRALGYFEPDGTYYEEELSGTIEYYCPECGQTLPEAIENEFFENENE